MQAVSRGVVACLVFGEPAVAPEPAHECVVLGDLLHPTRCREVVDAAVADVREDHPPRREPAQAQRRAHAAAFLVALAEVGDGAVNLCEKFRKHVGATGADSRGGLLERTRHEARDLFHCDAAGKFAGHRATHAVAHGERHVRAVQRRIAEFPEQPDFTRVELHAEERVLVVLAHLAAIREGGPAQAHGVGNIMLRVHSGGALDVGR